MRGWRVKTESRAALTIRARFYLRKTLAKRLLRRNIERQWTEWKEKKKIVIAFLCVASKLFFPSSSCSPHHNRIFSYFFMSIFSTLFFRSIVNVVVNALTFKWAYVGYYVKLIFFLFALFCAIISLQSRFARNLYLFELRRAIYRFRLIYCRWYLNWIGQIYKNTRTRLLREKNLDVARARLYTSAERMEHLNF